MCDVMQKCRVCTNTFQNRSYIVLEMMFGTRDEFEYFECSKCGCLQISQLPTNMDEYYPTNYYSYTDLNVQRVNVFKHLMKRQRMLHQLGERSLLGELITKFFGESFLPVWMLKAGLKLDSKILDVGCGSGQLLIDLREQGFLNLTGVDPFINKDIHYKNGVIIFKKELSELSDNFDFIMLHHSFEHVVDPIGFFKYLFNKVRLDGLILIRIPTVSSYAWKKYRTNWVQLDAPRHLYLHSIRSMEYLAQKSGFKIENIEFDSNEFQFWGSEQYSRDIPLNDIHSYSEGLDQSTFTQEDIEGFAREAESLNKSHKGDQACFYLRKVKP